jgi:UDP-2-acetamido-2-deoxy-ribo-hexuluronate aminotransferase
MSERIKLFDAAAERAAVGPACAARIADVIASGQFILGPEVAAAETLLAHYVSQPPPPVAGSSPLPLVRCVGVASGTDALHLTLLALGLSAGHTVVTTPFTWISSAEVVPLVGAAPIFADIDPSTYCLDPAAVRAAIAPTTRAVIAVSLFGRVPDYAAMRAAVDDAAAAFGTDIALIEDGAQSFGARGADGWRSCGSPHVDAATTSFFPSKPLGCYGDGGAVFTRDPRLADAIRSRRAHGRDAASGLHTVVGLNGRLDALQAAVVVAKMPVFDALVAARVAVGERYRCGLSGDARLVLPETGGGQSQHVFGVYTVRLRERDAVAKLLSEAGVQTAVYYRVCVHRQPVFAEAREGAPPLPVAEKVSKYVLSLPVHAHLGEEDQRRVIATLLGALDTLGVTDAPPD